MKEIKNALFILDDKERKESIEKIIATSTPTKDFFLMIAAASIITALGILINNITVVLGGMLVAPILSPILALALGIEMGDFKLIRRTLWTILKAVLVVLGFSILISIFVPLVLTDNTVLSNLDPSLEFGVIALISGVAAAFALAKKSLSESLPGVAVSVAILPPLAAVGVGLSNFEWLIIRDGLEMFAINLVAIVAAGVVIFSLMRFYLQRGEAAKDLKEEEKMLKKKVKDEDIA